MDNINLDHAIQLYRAIKNKKHGVTSDLGQLYFAIQMLGDEMVRLQKEVAKDSTKRIRKNK
jgi:hypothetical protein